MNSVLVPVVVRDGQGRAVGNLTKEDFQVLDNGKQRMISGFSVEKRAATSTEVTGDAEGVPVAGHAEPGGSTSSRFVVFLFDDMHMSAADMVPVKKAAVKILDEVQGKNDFASVNSILGRVDSGVTTDRAKLEGAIEKIQVSRSPYQRTGRECPNVDFYHADRIQNKHDRMTLESAIDETLVCARLEPGMRGEAENMVLGAAQQAIALGEQDARVTLIYIRELVRQMGNLPGQRTLILISPGFFSETPGGMILESQLIEGAARSNVTISTLDARGLYTNGPKAEEALNGPAHETLERVRSDKESLASTEEVMAGLADATGGAFFHNSNDIEGGLKRLAAAPEYVYLLELSLDNVKPDGKYHPLEVKVDHKDLRVQARRGYVELKPEMARALATAPVPTSPRDQESPASAKSTAGAPQPSAVPDAVAAPPSAPSPPAVVPESKDAKKESKPRTYDLNPPEDGKIHLDVTVAAKSGPPVSGLQRQDFSVLDNKAKQTLTSFRAVDGRETRIGVLVVVDAVNVRQQEVAYVRDQIEKFLLTDGGHLAYPTTVAVFTDTGTDIQEGLTDGNALSAWLEKSTIGHRYLGGSSSFYGAAERFQLSLRALTELAAREAARPGRKIILWVSPGWPLLSAPNTGIGTKQQQQLFTGVVSLSSTLLQGRITLYSIDPLGTTTDAADSPTFYWKDFLKGISKPNQVLPGNLALEVIATQSGGVAISSSNDVARSLRECLADTRAYYELTFDPPTSDQPDEYHHLEVHVAKRGLIPRTRQGYYSQVGPAQSGAVELERPSKAGDGAPPQSPATPSPASEGTNNPSSSTSEHPYIDLPLAELVERIPELKPLQPAPDQAELGMILQKMGQRVDDFMRDIGDLIADEDVTQELLNAKGKIKARERVQDEYLILHHGYEWGARAEYRMDEKGNRLGPIGLEKGYLVTSGFALSCVSFGTATQSQSRFRYLGEERIGSRETYVLGFAQQPGKATFTATMVGTGGAEINMLTQGILWLDKDSFQILRMRSDLLAPNHDIRLDQQTTDITFGEIKLPDVPNPLWLPSSVETYMEIAGQKYRNIHHYTKYRRYRVSVKIVAPQ